MPVLAHHLADPEKGTGIAMICTFGDTTDVTWWRELNLPSRALIGFDGRMAAGDTDVDHRRPPGRRATREVAGSPPKQAQTQDRRACSVESGEMLRRTARRSRTRSSSTSAATRPLEIVATRQWYIRNGGRDDALRGPWSSAATN